MALPPGRKPLTDKDMIDLLYTMAAGVGTRDKSLESDLRETADRLAELSKNNSGKWYHPQG